MMMSSVGMLVLLFFSLSVPPALVAPPPPPPPPAPGDPARVIQPDFYVLALQWPQTISDQQTESSGVRFPLPARVSGWTVHGLWPSNAAHDNTTDYCAGPPFSPAAVAPAEPALTVLWPCIHVDSNNTDFWAHEWERHGTCAAAAGDVHGMLDFFVWTLHLALQYDPGRVLHAAGFPPRADAYLLDDFIGALVAALPKNFVVVCAQVFGRQELAELRVCLDRQWQPADCFPAYGGVTYIASSCKSSLVYFPELEFSS